LHNGTLQPITSIHSPGLNRFHFPAQFSVKPCPQNAKCQMPNEITTMPLRLKEKLWGVDIAPVANRELISSIGEYFGHDFSKVKFRRGGILPYIVPFNYSAIVIGETVNVREGSEFLLDSPLVMAEELYHVIQWRRLGCAKMPFVYIASHLKNGYGGNRIEVEAKARAREFADSVKSKQRFKGERIGGLD